MTVITKQWTRDELNALAEQLYQRRADAKYVKHEYFESAIPAKCHNNVANWIALHPSHRAVRGWLIGDHDGWFRFNAHSVVERDDDGSLIDITPSDPPMPFLRHPDRVEHFFDLVVEHKTPYLTYPPEAENAVLDFTDPDTSAG